VDPLLNRYREEGVTMAMTMEEFRHYYLKEFIHELSPEERLKGLPPEERLKGLSREETKNYLERLKGRSSPEGNQAGESKDK
jgi:hypothetical protein